LLIVTISIITFAVEEPDPDFLVVPEDELLGLVKIENFIIRLCELQENILIILESLCCRHMPVFYGEAVLGQAVLYMLYLKYVLILTSAKAFQNFLPPNSYQTRVVLCD
jgi:hypothetical protein